MFYYVYLLYCGKDGSIYVGFTSDLKKRLTYHQAGKTKTTRERGPVKFIYAESYLNQTDARKREKFLKSGRGRELIKKQLAETLADIV